MISYISKTAWISSFLIVTFSAQMLAESLRFGISAQGTSNLRILILEGGDAINVIRQDTERRITVQVQEVNVGPVSGAEVRFTLPPSGASGQFSDGNRTLTTRTDEQGLALISIRPNGLVGPVTIQVDAMYRGQSVRSSINQRNAPPVEGFGSLSIKIEKGAGVTNNVRQAGQEQQLAVQIVEENFGGVEDADVTFTLPEKGAGGLFAANEEKTITIQTAADGLAATGLKHNQFVGPFNIMVSARFNQHEARTFIPQRNVSPRSWKKRGLLLTLLGGAGAAAIVVTTRKRTEPPPPLTPTIVLGGDPGITP